MGFNMKTIAVVLCLSAALLTVSCTKRSDAGNPPQTPSKEVVVDGVTYTEVQIDFSGHSSEGGMIFADLLKGTPAILDAQILGERGKRDFKIDLRSPEQTLITDTIYEYDKSIAEGEVNIKSETQKNYILENGKLWQMESGKKIPSADNTILKIYNEVLNMTNMERK